MKTLYTIGHSNKPVESLIARLDQHQITVVVDVRSKPYSQYNPQFNREELAETLRLAGRPYVFSGHSLGGIPQDLSLRNKNGDPDYGKIRSTEAYLKELSGILQATEEGRLGRIALMCSEADPSHCHRRRLIGVDVVEQGFELMHIMGDGALQAEHEIRERLGENQPSALEMFGKEKI